jgi:hypothetical protein
MKAPITPSPRPPAATVEAMSILLVSPLVSRMIAPMFRIELSIEESDSRPIFFGVTVFGFCCGGRKN